jgi:IMP dehydrogenase
MRFLDDRSVTTELTYSEAFLVPSRSSVVSRLDVDLTPVDGVGGALPIVSANMTAVTGRRMAETMARRGGLAVLPQDVPVDVVVEVVRRVKACHPVLETPVVMQPQDTVVDALNLVSKRAHRAVVVVDDQDFPVGVVSEGDCDGADRFAQLHTVMSQDLVVLDADRIEGQEGLRQGFDLLERARSRFAPVVRDGGLVGVLTRTGALRSTIYSPALDGQGRLRVGAAVGINGDVAAKTRGLVEAGVDILVVDTAHGHQERMVEALRQVRSVDPGIPVVAGNVVTSDGVRGTGTDRGRCRCGQGGGRPGGDVHHPDDDRGRTSTAVGGAGLCAGRSGAGPARVGGRGDPPSPGCGVGVGGGGRPGDDRLLARRDL